MKGSISTSWYWITIALVIGAVIEFDVFPMDFLLRAYFSFVFGILLVVFLPGFSFIRMLYPSSAKSKIRSEDLGKVERLAMSFGSSLALTCITGLILNFTPWGIGVVPTTLSLSGLTVVFATVAILRESRRIVGNRKNQDFPNFKV